MPAKKKIKCNITDAPAPTGDMPVFKIRAPFAIELNEKNRMLEVRSGVSFDVPVILFENPGPVHQGTQLLNSGTLFPSGKEIVCALEQKDGASIFERGDSLAYVVLLLPVNAELDFE